MNSLAGFTVQRPPPLPSLVSLFTRCFHSGSRLTELKPDDGGGYGEPPPQVQEQLSLLTRPYPWFLTPGQEGGGGGPAVTAVGS